MDEHERLGVEAAVKTLQAIADRARTGRCPKCQETFRVLDPMACPTGCASPDEPTGVRVQMLTAPFTCGADPWMLDSVVERELWLIAVAGMLAGQLRSHLRRERAADRLEQEIGPPGEASGDARV